MMSDASGTPTRPPLGRIALLGIVVLIGLGFFFALGRSTPAVGAPAGMEEQP
jgi:hypothetical protein